MVLIMKKYDSWLESGAHDNESEEIYVDERSAELLKTTYNPCNIHNFHEAIQEDALYQHKEQIEKAMQERDFLTLGRIIWSDVFDHWENNANNCASEEFNQGLG
jgi:hypothetical protein